MSDVPISCGVLVLATTGELLLGHATGSRRWDIFKGMQEAHETALETALRELHEECGLTPHPADLRDLGRFAYLPRKGLHLFAVMIDRIDTSALKCTSTFTDRFGRRRPELDGFDWVPFDQVSQRCGKGMSKVLMSLRSTSMWRTHSVSN